MISLRGCTKTEPIVIPKHKQEQKSYLLGNPDELNLRLLIQLDSIPSDRFLKDRAEVSKAWDIRDGSLKDLRGD